MTVSMNADIYIYIYISVNAAQDAIPLEVIKLHTNTDPNLNAVRKAVESGDCSTDRVKPFLNIKEEITVDHANGILLRETRIIIRRLRKQT